MTDVASMEGSFDLPISLDSVWLSESMNLLDSFDAFSDNALNQYQLESLNEMTNADILIGDLSPSSNFSSSDTSPPTSPLQLFGNLAMNQIQALSQELSTQSNFSMSNEAETPSSPSSSSDEKSKSQKVTVKRSRKRARTSKKETMAPTAVTLPRDQLLKLSSQELDDYAESIRAVRPLTEEEEKDIKRQRRLIKNRESAHLSRQRRKTHLSELEDQVKALTSENLNLKDELSLLKNENVNLKEHVDRLTQQFFKDTNHELNDSLNDDLNLNYLDSKMMPSSLNESPTPAISTFNKIASVLAIQKKGGNSTTIKSTGVFLFILLVYFGLFFNVNNPNPGLKFRDDIFQNINIPTNIYSSEGIHSSSAISTVASGLYPNTGRHLLDNQKAENMSVPMEDNPLKRSRAVYEPIDDECYNANDKCKKVKYDDSVEEGVTSNTKEMDDIAKLTNDVIKRLTQRQDAAMSSGWKGSKDCPIVIEGEEEEIGVDLKLNNSNKASLQNTTLAELTPPSVAMHFGQTNMTV